MRSQHFRSQESKAKPAMIMVKGYWVSRPSLTPMDALAERFCRDMNNQRRFK